ncbi:hypothetical protein CDL12_10406 [Handroanthus impetiginosus]|uniref:Uncharacterized protein n=1 Tax=Handroanthus impetiginosus TaxID=429701 RepID=A0A2G9HHF1_9LAMI|nr:hypothetical protein CDL12_10406 [Handroanthus impetiginosus]
MCLQEIKKEITEIRNCYEEGSTDRYCDDELARMMLLDASFITVHIATNNTLGYLSTSIALQDMCLVENQIPFWIVELLLSIFTPGDEEKVLNSSMTDEKVLHLLERFYMVFVFDIHEPKETRWSLTKLWARFCKCMLFKKAKGDLKILVHSFRSLTELKTKGIHLKPSPTQSLQDVNFKSNFTHAELQLPTLSAFPNTKTLFLNMMCYELDAQTWKRDFVTSYVNFMKSLIVKPEDVKELREKKILLGLRGSDEEIVKMYQDFNTHGVDNPHIYQNVKDMIESHYNSKTKAWMAEVISTYSRIPWTFLTLLVVVLIALQTTYTIKS